MHKLPKDLANAKRGYEAFYDEQPNIWFEDLAHQYQMRWVRAARAILEENKSYNGPGRRAKEPPVSKGEFWVDIEHMPAEAFLKKHVPKAGKRWGWNKMENVEHRKAALAIFKKWQKAKSANGA